jgi:hypothetical protein
VFATRIGPFFLRLTKVPLHFDFASFFPGIGLDPENILKKWGS